MRTPMPSPRGTNLEGLTLRGGLAYDAAPEPDKDEDKPKGAADDLTESLMGILAGKLSDEDMAAVMALLRPDAAASAEPAMDAAHRARLARDFAAGRIGMDAFMAGCRKSTPRAPTAGDRTDFAAMFPNAGSVKLK